MGFRSIPTFRIGGPPDIAFTSRIVSKDPREIIGILNTNDVVPEFILRNGAAVRITHFGSQRFTPTHFKPFAIPRTIGSGVGHQTFHGDQLRIARGQCVRVFFTTFQVLKGVRPPTVANVNVGREAFKCVVFRTK